MFVHGERWNAVGRRRRSPKPDRRGRGIDGLTLTSRRAGTTQANRADNTIRRTDGCSAIWSFFVPILIIVIAFLAFAIKILREYERGVMFTLGRFTG